MHRQEYDVGRKRVEVTGRIDDVLLVLPCRAFIQVDPNADFAAARRTIAPS